ncbi:MAG TPA: PIG-L deacetylase family protein [Jatrophihabitans sp.]|nr:PIG-L deacetylase family protein [Jatrophihabitans sp.]
MKPRSDQDDAGPPVDAIRVWQPAAAASSEIAELSTVLCVMAHPDDVDFAAAGTVAALTAQGVAVSYCVLTDGEQGGYDPTVSRTEMAAIRRREQVLAAKAVGVSEVTFLGWPDGSVQPTLELRKAICAVLRMVRPDLVITHSPSRNLDRIYSSHPDHLACGEATLAAVYPDARNQFCYPELNLQPHLVSRAWLIGNDAPDFYVDVTDYVPAKRAALLAHASQRPGISADGEVDRFLQTMLQANAERCRLPSGRSAESFRSIATD